MAALRAEHLLVAAGQGVGAQVGQGGALADADEAGTLRVAEVDVPDGVRRVAAARGAGRLLKVERARGKGSAEGHGVRGVWGTS